MWPSDAQLETRAVTQSFISQMCRLRAETRDEVNYYDMILTVVN